MTVNVRGIRFSLPLAFTAVIGLCGALLLLVACNSSQVTPVPYTVSGMVADANGPVAGAIVQVQGTPNQATTSKDGSYTLHGQGLGGTDVVTVTAWAEGHFIGWVNLDPQKPIWKDDGTGVAISLKPLYTVDNNDYTWFTFQGVSGSASCGLCHREYKEWQNDAHAQSSINPRFLTMYRGTNAHGQQGQFTVLQLNGKAQPPDPAQPYYGPGYQLDFPGRAGNCATCHTPLAARTPIQQNCAWAGCHTSTTAEHAALQHIELHGVEPIDLMGIGAEGVACEFCHKVSAVTLDPKTHLPFPDRPGILSMQLSRPPDGQQLFYGTLTDSARRVTYLPLETQSEFCAPCHYGVMGGVMGVGTVTGGTEVYNSYSEWLHSSYSDPKTGKTCQDCHMQKADSTYSVFPEQGGISRDYVTLHDHTIRGTGDQTLMWSAVSLTSTVTHNGGTLEVHVSVTNDKAGHDVPTDDPLRSVMLVVEVVDANGKPITLKAGPKLPAWTGNYNGAAGRYYAQILKDNWSGEAPTPAYWRPVTLVEDTRLKPFATDNSTYTFDLPAGATATVKTRVIYRRAFQQLEQQKGWNDSDIPMAEATIPVQH